MVVYFRGHSVRITHEVFEIRCPSYQVFSLADLAHLRVVEQTADPPPVVNAIGVGSTGVAGTTAVAAGLGWVEGWQVFDSPAVAFTVLAMLIAAMVTAAACARARVVERELVAQYRGTPISLFRSPDPAAFGQVKRGLLRALNRLEDTR